MKHVGRLMILVFVGIAATISGSAQTPLVCDRNCIANTRTILKDEAFSKGYLSGWTEKANLRLGDKVAIALRVIYKKRMIFNASYMRVYLPVIRRSFSIPEMISEPEAQRPELTLLLLDEVERNTKDPIVLQEIKITREYVEHQANEVPAKPVIGRAVSVRKRLAHNGQVNLGEPAPWVNTTALTPSGVKYL